MLLLAESLQRATEYLASMQSSPVLRSAGVHVQQQEQCLAGDATFLPKALQPKCTAAVACRSACSSVIDCYLFIAVLGGKLFAVCHSLCRILLVERCTNVLHWLPSAVSSSDQVNSGQHDPRPPGASCGHCLQEVVQSTSELTRQQASVPNRARQ